MGASTLGWKRERGGRRAKTRVGASEGGREGSDGRELGGGDRSIDRIGS